jgi:hypothetical protein
MAKTDDAAGKNQNDGSIRKFVCGLIELSGNRLKFKGNRDFFTQAEAGFSGFISLDCGDDAANLDKMKAAAEYFAALAQDLRQTITLYQGENPETVAPVAAEVRPRNQQQQAEHLEMIHAILGQLPEAEQELYQRFGFGERARLYKMVDYETDPVKMSALICAMIKAISEEKGELGSGDVV